MERGTLLLASSGKEFTKPTRILASSMEVKKARKEAMGRLGLDFLESVGGTDDIDIEKELADEDGDIEMENGIKIEENNKPLSPVDDDIKMKDSPLPGPSKSPTPAAPSPAPPEPSDDVDLSQLSARERNRLKRKRKGGNSAFVAAPPPPQSSNSKYATTPAGPSNKSVRFCSLIYSSSNILKGPAYCYGPTEALGQSKVSRRQSHG